MKTGSKTERLHYKRALMRNKKRHAARRKAHCHHMQKQKAKLNKPLDFLRMKL